MDWESIAIPIVLMLTGIILLGGDFLGLLSLDKIQNLWPAAVIVVGVIELLPWYDEPARMPARAESRNDRSRDVPQVR